MSNLITTAFVRMYTDKVELKFQQKAHEFAGTYRSKQSTAEKDFFEYLGATAAYQKTTRHGDTQYVDSQHERRFGTKKDWAWADLIDKEDRVRMLIEPQSEYTENAVAAINREDDEQMVIAFDAAVSTGKDGDGTETYDTTNLQIANGSAGCTVGKLQTMKLTMDTNEVPKDGRVFAVSPTGVQDLLEDAKITSSDFNTVRALVMGDVNTYMGYRFIQSNRLTDAGSSIRECWGWHPSCMGKLEGTGITVNIDRLPTKHYATQVYVSKCFGYVRLQQNGVIQLDIDESV